MQTMYLYGVDYKFGSGHGHIIIRLNCKVSGRAHYDFLKDYIRKDHIGTKGFDIGAVTIVKATLLSVEK